MRQSRRALRVLLVVCSILFGTAAAVRAFPPLPSSFYGSVRLNGADLPDGTLVEALIGDQVCAYSLTHTYEGHAVYALDIPGDDTSTTVVDGGQEGEVIRFRVGGILAPEAATWHSGTNVRLDLTATSSGAPLAPQPTWTPLPTQTPIAPAETPPPPTQVTATGIAPSSARSTAPGATEPAIAAHVAPQAAPASTPAAPTEGSPPSTEPVELERAGAETAATLPSGKVGGNLAFWLAIPAVVLSICLALGLRRLRRAE